jgi:chromosomal replication initiation ATPase DnaA
MRGLPAVREITSKRIGNALRRLAEDLATERRRAVLLEQENRELRTRLEALRRRAQEQEASAPREDPSSRDAAS